MAENPGLPGTNVIRERRTTFRVLGVAVDAVQIPDVVAQMERWISAPITCHFVAVTGMHGISESHREDSFKEVLNAADLVVPDGMPLVWLGRYHGYALKRRVYGPELMQSFCETTSARYRHFFYGGTPSVSTLLGQRLHDQYGINIAGSYSPPFGPLSKQDDEQVTALINETHPDVLWVGLSTPKQERWIYEHRYKLTVPVVLGVGAAFDFNSGSVRQAPRWMRERGLEWLFRLLLEPRRLWRRYLIRGPEFVWNVTAELLSIRKFS